MQESSQAQHLAKQTSEMPGAVPGAKYMGSETCKTSDDELSTL